jgi:nitrite reductase/ring-hydroxylating ferredoxin subunit
MARMGWAESSFRRDKSGTNERISTNDRCSSRPSFPAYIRIVKRLPFLLLPLAVLLVNSCKKENQTGVPPVQLDVTINVNLPEYADLQVPGGWAYLTGGSQGLIVYRKSTDEFVAMDRHCPYQTENLCRVFVDESEVQARDSACCHSAFLLFDGSVTTGPSTFPLKTYHTIFNGTTLRIYS